jgi:hypothetical protein
MCFNGVFELPSPRNTQKRDKPTKNGGEGGIKKKTIFWGEFSASHVDMDFVQKHLHGVFELPSAEQRPKTH